MPRYIHDCQQCRYLGPYKEYDLYVCSHKDQKIDTVVARYSSDGPEYYSGVNLVKLYRAGKLTSDVSTSTEALLEALVRAEYLGYTLK